MKITIDAHEVIFNGSKLPAYARVYCQQQFINDDDQTVLAGLTDSSNYVKQVAVTNNAGIATIAPFSGANELDSTVDENGTVISTYALTLHDSNGKLLEIVYPSLRIPRTPTTTSWDDIVMYGEMPDQPMRYEYYTKAEIDRILAGYASTALKATTVQLGVVKISDNAADLNNPIAVADTDSRMPVNIATYGDVLSDAITAIGVTQTILQITRPVAVDENTTVPNNITLDIQGRGLLQISNGFTLTIGSMLDAGTRKIFSGLGTVKFAPGAVEKMNIAWWVGNDDGIDITDAIDEALLSCSDNGGGIVYVPEGRWESDGEHVLPTNTTIEGCGAFAGAASGAGATMVTLTRAAVALLRVEDSTSNILIRDIKLDGDSQVNSTGILCEGTYPNTSGGLRVQNCAINFFNHGFRLSSLPAASQWQFSQISFDNCTFSSNMHSAVRCNTVNTGLRFDSCLFAVQNDGWVFYLENCGTFTADGCEFAGLSGQDACVGGIPGPAMAEGVVYTSGQHLPLNFDGCQDEGFRYFIYNVSSDSLYSSFNLSGCLVQSIIMLTASCVVNSINCNYRSKTFKDSGFTDARIISTGDHVQSTDLCGNVVDPPVLTDFSAGSIVAVQTDFFRDEIFHRLPTTIEAALQAENFSMTNTEELTPFGTVEMDCSLSNRWTLTPTSAVSIDAVNIVPGKKYYLTILTSGISSFNVGFGTGFRANGNIVTGVVSGKYFVLEFYSPDGATIIETSRTTAL